MGFEEKSDYLSPVHVRYMWNIMSEKQINERIVAAGFLLILAGALFVFWPALSGPFLLDDFVHFPKLSQYGQIDSIEKVLKLIFSNEGASGRPLSFLSLLISDNAWPSDPYGFKYTNLLIHILNGVLVFLLCRKIASILETKTNGARKANLVALVAMAIWLLHPINISAMMLTIQRMTLLMAFFSLAGLLVYLKGREVVTMGGMSKGYWLMSIGIGVFGVLGVLAKEPAVMMVCYVLVLEVTVFSSVKLYRPPYWRAWMAVFIWLPLFMIAAYFIVNLDSMMQYYIKREFDVWERLMSESRVLMVYISLLILPSISRTGPYHDDFVVSTGLFSPASTLLSILCIAGLIYYALLNRKKRPLLALPILWFFMGHILESTILPLELYFEHRNYLPMLGLVFSVAYFVVHYVGRVRRFVIIGTVAFICLEVFVSHSAATVWGNRALVANVWAQEHPRSMRAQIDAMRFWLGVGRADKARHHFDIARHYYPDDAGMALFGFVVDRCNSEPFLEVSMDDLRGIIPSAPFEHASVEAIQFVMNRIEEGRACEVTNQELLEIMNMYLENPLFYGVKKIRSIIYRHMATVYMWEGDLDNTIQSLDLAYDAVSEYGVALNQAYLLLTAGLYIEAEEYIKKARDTPLSRIGVALWKENDIRAIEKILFEIRKDKTNAAQ